MVLHRLLLFMVPVGGPGESPFVWAIYLGLWWPGQSLEAGVRIVGGRLWLPGPRDAERAATRATCEMVEVRRGEVAAPGPA